MPKVDVNLIDIDESPFVDKDIAEAFKDGNHFIGIPSLIQLNRNLKEIISLLKKGKTIGGIP